MVNLEVLVENFEEKSKKLLSEVSIPEDEDEMADLLRDQGRKIASKQNAHLKKALKAANKKFGENLKEENISDDLHDTFELSEMWEMSGAIVAGQLSDVYHGSSKNADTVWEYVMLALMENAYKILGKPNAKLMDKFEDEGGDVEYVVDMLKDEGGAEFVYPNF